MSDWRTYAVGDVAEIFDGPHATPTKTPDGPWFLSISSLVAGRLELAESAHLSEADFTRWTRRVTPSPGDVLFSYETRLGEAALMPEGVRAALGRRMGLLRPRRDLVDPRFLLLAYRSPGFQQVIRERRIHGATVDRIPLVDLPRWPIEIPGFRTQRQISAILGALDDKIAVNDRIARTAKDLGQATFAAHVAGSRIAIQDAGGIVMGQSPPGESYNETGDGIPFYQGTRDFGFFFPGRRVWCTAVTRQAGAGDVLVSVRAPVGEVNVASEACGIGRGLAALRAHASPHVLSHALMADPAVWAPFEGEGTVFSSIDKKQLHALKIKWPDRESEARLDHRLRVLDERLMAALLENLSLAALRNALLPELMSGRLRVRDAEKVVEEAV